MRKSNLLVVCLFLTGCATQQIETVTKVERVVVRPPVEMLNIPPRVMDIDVDNATQRDVAQWILQSEQRTQQLEEQLKSLKKFFDETD